MRLKIYIKRGGIFKSEHVIYEGMIASLEQANSKIEAYCRTHVDQQGETLYWDIVSEGRRTHNGVIRPAKQ